MVLYCIFIDCWGYNKSIQVQKFKKQELKQELIIKSGYVVKPVWNTKKLQVLIR